MRRIKIKTKDKDIDKLQERLGIKLKADFAEDTVNGHVNITSEGIEVILYEEDEDPTFEVYKKDSIKYTRGRKTTIRKVNSISEVESLAEKLHDII